MKFQLTNIGQSTYSHILEMKIFLRLDSDSTSSKYLPSSFFTSACHHAELFFFLFNYLLSSMFLGWASSSTCFWTKKIRGSGKSFKYWLVIVSLNPRLWFFIHQCNCLRNLLGVLIIFDFRHLHVLKTITPVLWRHN